ncbi:Carbonic anhydrase 3 [Blattella germanica]|nr:Carbonic anhydrase 3 [Blattella germanica]
MRKLKVAIFVILIQAYLDCVSGKGSQQSPIDLKNARPRICDDLVYNYFDDGKSKKKVRNNGHTVKITYDQGYLPSVTGGPLFKDTFIFVEVHFHWGTNDQEGAEHTINGAKYSMETHVVHYNKKYGSLEKALHQKDGVAVSGILMKDLAPGKNEDNKLLLPLTNRLEQIHNEQASFIVSGDEILSWLWPFLKCDKYYTYFGSLTTPDYNEVVTWVVYQDIMHISTNQVQ